MAQTAFDHIERDAAGHFRITMFAAIYRIVHGLRLIDGAAFEAVMTAHPFLRRYIEEMLPHLPDGLAWDATLHWWHSELAAWELDCPANLPLLALTRAGVLDWQARLALMIVALVEEDGRFGSLFEALQRPAGGRRPAIGLIGHLLTGREEGADGWSVCRNFINAGLADILNPDAPRAEWTLRVPGAVWSAMRGEAIDALPQTRLLPPDNFAELAALDLDATLAGRLARVPAGMAEGQIRTLVVRGMPGSGQMQVIGAVARTLGLGLAVIEARREEGATSTGIAPLLGPLCVMRGYLPVFVFDLSPGETADLPSIPAYAGPCAVALGPEGGIAGGPDAALTLSLPVLTEAQRLRCWRAALGAQDSAELERISARFILPAAHIAAAAAMALRQAALDRRNAVCAADVREACRMLNRQMLERHAARIDGGGDWDDLVVSAEVAARLRDLERRCRHRETLLRHLGRAFAGSTRGVRALFTGASGTGKTLAARILAAKLGIDLYRVDLGAVVNKYIGETEKNLHQVLSRAESLDVILLLDEGDSLLGARTEVKSANDRYANLETNYLLQRLENFAGIVLVTTNAPQQIDRAFARRMDCVVSFVHPQAEERRDIWRAHLPGAHAISSDFIESVVRRCALTGGQIRNAAMQASLLAVDGDARRVLRDMHLEAALRTEYAKAGATYPLEISQAAQRSDGVGAFLAAMRA